MSSNDLVYRTHADWREAYGFELFGGFARMLKPSPGSVVFRDVARVRHNACVPLERKRPQRAETAAPQRHATPWTPERIAALPRTSGQLTRIGDKINVIQCANRKTGKLRTKYTVACQCTCGKVIHPQISTWVSLSRPRSCRPCVFVRQRKGLAFTDKGYAQGREFAAQRGKAA